MKPPQGVKSAQAHDTALKIEKKAVSSDSKQDHELKDDEKVEIEQINREKTLPQTNEADENEVELLAPADQQLQVEDQNQAHEQPTSANKSSSVIVQEEEEEVEEVRNSCDEALVSTQPAKIPLRLTLDIEAIDQ